MLLQLAVQDIGQLTDIKRTRRMRSQPCWDARRIQRVHYRLDDAQLRGHPFVHRSTLAGQYECLSLPLGSAALTSPSHDQRGRASPAGTSSADR